MGMSKGGPTAVSGLLKSLSTRCCTQIYRSSSRVLGLSRDIRFHWYNRHNLSNSSSTHDLKNWDLTIGNDCRVCLLLCSSHQITWRRQLERGKKEFFWLVVSKGSIHGCLYQYLGENITAAYFTTEREAGAPETYHFQLGPVFWSFQNPQK